MSMKLITDYLFELSRNNNREWYHANKEQYKAANAEFEALRNKSWYLEYPVSDEILLQPDFIDRAEEIFTAMKPFNTFMNQALKNFTMPSR